MTLEELVELRKRLNLTQTEMAEALGLKLRAYQDVEGGQAALRKMHVLAAERVALSMIAKGKLGEDFTDYIKSRDWLNRLFAEARAFADPLE